MPPSINEDSDGNEKRYETVYTGSAIRPAVKVTGMNGLLTEGTDYTVKYSANTNAGQAKVVISGIGNYMGTVTKTFRILPDKTSVITADLSDPSAKICYDSKGAAPAVAVSTVRNGKTVALEAGKDYKVSYSGNKKAWSNAAYTVSGTYQVTRPSSGTVDLTKARIMSAAKNKAGNYIALTAQAYTGNEIRPEITVLVKKGNQWAPLDTSAYTVTYLNNVEKGRGVVLVTGKENQTEGDQNAGSQDTGNETAGIRAAGSKTASCTFNAGGVK